MKINKKYYRHFIKKLIEQDPTDATFYRYKIVDDGFGGFTEEKDARTVRCRFYKKHTSREAFEIEGISVNFARTAAAIILAEHDADIKEKDILIWGDREYRVNTVADYLGICKQCKLDTTEQIMEVKENESN